MKGTGRIPVFRKASPAHHGGGVVLRLPAGGSRSVAATSSQRQQCNWKAADTISEPPLIPHLDWVVSAGECYGEVREARGEQEGRHTLPRGSLLVLPGQPLLVLPFTVATTTTTTPLPCWAKKSKGVFIHVLRVLVLVLALCSHSSPCLSSLSPAKCMRRHHKYCFIHHLHPCHHRRHHPTTLDLASPCHTCLSRPAATC
ncbi:hypothetical protein E2C01_026541 [Portunus trituberculatus]|uniref:Uncharacterized protein n=1 Tax=Portunus trituberculatus TaxID=210409 RepID=A0A5B7EIF1_PORTR|nr:hypothetical protein [Portunus trituberculatus]